MAELESEDLTPEDMRQWLQQEIRDLSKAVELRMQEATDLVAKYASGKLTREEAMEKWMRYHYRWGESPIPGVTTREGMTNEEILSRLDNALPSSVREILRSQHKGSPTAQR
jgi:hypothetical protein